MAWEYRPTGYASAISRGVYIVIASLIILILGAYASGLARDNDPYILSWIASTIIYTIGGIIYAVESKHSDMYISDIIVLFISIIKMLIDYPLTGIVDFAAEYWDFSEVCYAKRMLPTSFIATFIFTIVSLYYIRRKTGSRGVF